MKKLHYCSYIDAYTLALKNVSLQSVSHSVLIDNALNRVLAEKITVVKNLPSFNNSAMDGFAFKYEERGKRLHIAATLFAGESPKPILQKESCYKIMTGAKVPSDADTIVPIEACDVLDDGYVIVPEDILKGNAFRFKGEEQKVGNVLFEKGERITPAHIALLSAQGIMAVNVYKSLDIAIVSTGDEIKEPWEVASDDEIYNANAFAISSLLKKHGFYTNYVGAIPDNLEESIKFIESLKAYDVIITTGGISMGDADYMQEAFIQNGLEVLFHGVEMKPGRATMMGNMGKSFVMALPGNPLAALVNVLLFAIPILTKMQGSSTYHHDFIYAKNIKSFHAKAGRSNVVLGSVSAGEFHVTRENRYGSGMLTPIVQSNALVVLDEEISFVKEGEIIKVILFDMLADAKVDKNLNTSS